MAQAGYTPISLYYSTTASAVPTAANLVPGELAININDGKLYYENSSGVVTLLASSSGASGDVVGPASATDNAIARFDLTTGKLIQNSSALVSDAGNVLAGSGSVSAPSFSTTGNTNTGIYFPTSDTIAFSEGGVEAMRISNTGTLGVGVTPSAWLANTAVQVKYASFWGFGTSSYASMGANYYYDGSYRYISNALASDYTQSNGGHVWRTAAAGTPGNAFSFTQTMLIDTLGNVSIGNFNPSTWTVGKALELSSVGSAVWAGTGILYNTAGYYYNGNDRFAINGYYAVLSSANAGDGSFRWSSSTATGTAGNVASMVERMRITSSGNVGIGTSSPASSAGYTTLTLNNSTNSGYVVLQTNGVTTSDWYVSGGTTATIRGVAVPLNLVATGANYISATTNGSERMRIDSSGNVGIGTSSPSNRLTVSGATPYVSVFNTSAGSIASPSFSGVGFYGVSENTNGLIASVDGGNQQANNLGGILRFSTQPDGGGGLSERLRIDSSGNALFAKAVRATITTDNDLSFDMNAASNFKCTPTAGGALTFTNITSGQTGNIILVNNSNYAITAAATTKVSSTCLATISATGTYWLSYYSDGTNVYVANTGALA